MPDYVNVDLRALPGVDVLADAQRLPFEVGTLDEIASAHLVEHFREHRARTRVLPYWKSLLRPGGRLRIVCPNWAAMFARLHDGRMTLQEFKLVTFGWQDYEGDDHFAMYTPETLRELLVDVGFGRVEVLAVDRMEGLCPEMEIVAHS
jgi:predicted SAM-dependent methyltransferase